MPVNLSATLTPQARLRVFMGNLRRAVEVVSDMQTTFEQIYHPFMLRHMADQFRSGGAAGGQPWAPLDREPKYQAYKRAIVGAAPLLRWPGATEQLYPSLATRGPDHIEISSRKVARFGTAVPHAARLERGGVGPFGEPYPARKILVMGLNTQRDLFLLIRRDLYARIGKVRRPQVNQ